MKYNEKYDRYVTKGGLVYRYSKRQDKLILCKLTTNVGGYLRVYVTKPEIKTMFVHRLVFETFVSEIPKGNEIDHINTVRDDNRLENLRCVTRKENMNNPITKIKTQKSLTGIVKSEFGRKFKKHFGITSYENPNLYQKEYKWYRKHNKTCSWEV